MRCLANRHLKCSALEWGRQQVHLMTVFNSGARDDQCYAVPTQSFENSPSKYVCVKHLMAQKTWCCFAEGELGCEPMAAHVSAFDKIKNSNQPLGSAQHIPDRSGL